MKKKLLIVLALGLSACGGGDETNEPSPKPFPDFLFNFGNVGFNSDWWSATDCEGRNPRVAFGSRGDCAMRDSNGCNEIGRNLIGPDCSWRVSAPGDGVVFDHEFSDINNVPCMRSIAEIRRGDSKDVFFGRPSYGFGHLTAAACEFRRISG